MKDLIERKTRANLWMPNPDMPDRQDARLYYAFGGASTIAEEATVQEDRTDGSNGYALMFQPPYT